MSNEISPLEIPRHGKAGVAFAGVELNDCIILIASVFLALPIGSVYGTPGFLGVPFAGYMLNKSYVTWRATAMPGQFKIFTFKMGFGGFSRAFDHQKTVFVGDSVVLNTGATRLLNEIEDAYITKEKN